MASLFLKLYLKLKFYSVQTRKTFNYGSKETIAEYSKLDAIYQGEQVLSKNGNIAYSNLSFKWKIDSVRKQNFISNMLYMRLLCFFTKFMLKIKTMDSCRFLKQSLQPRTFIQAKI